MFKELIKNMIKQDKDDFDLEIHLLEQKLMIAQSNTDKMIKSLYK